MDENLSCPERELHICHYCVTYKSSSKTSMKKHFEKKKECNKANEISYEKAKLVSLSKKFIFTFDYSNLLKDDFLYIVTNFNCCENIINKNFYKIKPPKSIYFEEFLQNEIKKYGLEDQTKNKIDNNLTEDQKFDLLYYNENSNKYVCDRCRKKYTSKQNLIHHKKNKKSCNLQIEINQIMEESINRIKQKKEENKE